MTKPTINLQELQARIGSRAKSAPTHRFWGLYTHIKKLEVIEAAYLAARQNNGAPGIDGVTFKQIEQDGRDEFLREIATALAAGAYKPRPYRRTEIPKSNGKMRTISIATIRDRVVHGAIKLILEPIFEADFSDSSFGARPGRQAHQALGRIKLALLKRKHRVVDVDLAAFFDNITHRVMLERLAKRIQDPEVLALLKQFLKGAGKRGIPQGSPLSPLIANLALTDLDHALDKGQGFIEYVRYLDDMVVLTPDSPKGHRWADRALQRIKSEAHMIGVELNEEKTRVVSITDPRASFSFLGFDLRWKRSKKSGKWYPHMVPRPKKVTELQAKVREVLQNHRYLAVEEVIGLVNPILRGWVNFFRVGNSGQAFGKIRYYVERKIRRFAARQRKRPGFGWKRWSNQVVYDQWGLFSGYQVKYGAVGKAALSSNRIITPT
jgi:RNA-directed DNA polymerase